MDATYLPRVTIVIATNRSSKFLQNALDSIVRQTYTDWEVVVVANGDVDVDRIAESVALTVPAATVVYQKTPGLSLARNLGLSLAKGEFITFLDDDDEWTVDRLDRTVRALERSPHAILCYSAGVTIDAAGNVISTSWLPDGAGRHSLLAGDVDIPRIVTMLFRKSELIRIGAFNPNLRFAEDDEMILRAIRLGTIVSVPDALVRNRVHGGNVTASKLEARRTASDRAVLMQLWGAEAFGLNEDKVLLQQNRRRAAARTADALASNAFAAFRHGHIATGTRELARAFVAHPGMPLRTLFRKLRHA